MTTQFDPRSGLPARKARRWILLAASATLAIVAAGGTAKAKDLVIGWTSYPADLPVIADAIDGSKTAAAAIGAKMQFALSAGAAAQANAMDNLITLGVDVIAIDPEDSKAIGPSIKKANEANIPVVMFIGDNLGDGKTVTLISSDEEAGGYNIAKWAFEQIGGKGKVALVQGAKAHQAGQLRENGFRKAMAEFPGIELVGYGEANWMPDKANTLAADMLAKDPDLKLIVALSDGMAKGVAAAVKAAGVNPVVTGYNGDCETLNKVWTGQIAGDLYQGWRDIGGQVVKTSADIVAGKTIPPKIIMPVTIVDKPLMEKINGGSTDGVTPGLVADVKHAVAGCK